MYKLSEKEEKEVKAYKLSGYDLTAETPYSVELTKETTTTIGHIIAFIIFPIIGNIAYHYLTLDKVVIRKTAEK